MSTDRRYPTGRRKVAPRRKEAPATARVTEAQFQRAVLDLMAYTGWRAYHVSDSRTVTSAGFPDIVACKPRHSTLFVELKTTRGRLSPAQWDWRDDLESTGATYYLWRPDMWPEIEAVLTAPRSLSLPA